MRTLIIYQQGSDEPLQVVTDFSEIAQILKKIEIGFDQWFAAKPIANEATEAEILSIYQPEIEKLVKSHQIKTVDVVSLRPNNPNAEAMRAKYLQEHTHSDYEIRFFVFGGGLFYVHVADKVYALECVKDDLIVIPPKIKHWFDMSSSPNFTAIRFFRVPEGWVAEFTGDQIADFYPKMEAAEANIFCI